jgi:hypothetical protein
MVGSRGREGKLPAQKDGTMLPSPGFEQRIYSPHTIAAIAAELGEQGIDMLRCSKEPGSPRRSSNSP